MWSKKLLESSRFLGYNIILRDTVKNPAENAKDNTKEDIMLKKLKKNAYNDLILVQYDTVC